MILSCEKDIVDTIDIQDIVTKWSSAKQKRVKF